MTKYVLKDPGGDVTRRPEHDDLRLASVTQPACRITKTRPVSVTLHPCLEPTTLPDLRDESLFVFTG